MKYFKNFNFKQQSNDFTKNPGNKNKFKPHKKYDIEFVNIV